MTSHIYTTGSRPVFRVFYAWQSDTPAKWNRSLLNDALCEAAEQLGKDVSLGVHVEIDQDTRGKTGWCDVPATILEKIKTCDCAVFDLTFIAATTREHCRVSSDKAWSTKLCSNPNVLFELGYALHSIGEDRLICVANEAFGSYEDNVNFDFHHRRHPIAYILDDTSGSKPASFKRLVEVFRESIGEIIRDKGLLSTIDVSLSADLFAQEIQRVRHVCCKVDKMDDATNCPRWTSALTPLFHSGERWNDIDQLRDIFQNQLERRTGWMRVRARSAVGAGWGLCGNHDSEMRPGV